MATAINQSIDEDRIDVYVHALNDLDEPALRHGFEMAMRSLGEFLPSIQQIRNYAESFRPTTATRRQFESVADIDPEKCPKGWTPEDVFRAHLTQEKIRREARR